MIKLIYNAAGQKVQKVVTTTTPASVVTTDYLGGYQYKNTVLQYFPTAEGYVKNTPMGSTNAYSYVFNYTDHLGNTRLSYTKDAATGSLKILEESNYYPFGLKHNGYNPISPIPENRRLFNGKELQEELGLNQYDYGARNYDPSYVRTLTQDPLAEKFYSYSSYSFLNNNPISYIDPSGMEAYKSQVDRSSEMSNSEWNSNRRADMDRQAGGDGMDIANPDGYVKNRSTATASDAQEEDEDSPDNGYDENGNKINDKGGDTTDYLYRDGKIISSTSVSYRSVAGNGSLRGYGFKGFRMASGAINEDNSIANFFIGGIIADFIVGNVVAKAGSIKIPIYRVYGEGASMYGKSYSLINPKYVPFYRNFAGLPNINSGQFLLKGSIPLRDVNVGRWFAAPLNGNTGGLPFELYQNYNQLINPVNIMIKKKF